MTLAEFLLAYVTRRSARRGAVDACPPCLEDPCCALTLGFQWCTCYSPALTHAREEWKP